MEKLADGVWAIRSALRMPGGVVFPLRMTVIRLPSGGLWVHSPVALTDEQAAAIDALGPVEHLVAPSLMHHLHLHAAHARWPEAKVWGAPGLADKQPELHLDGLIGDAGWPESIETRFLEGAPMVNETVFFHPASGVLLCTDLVFNVQEGGFASWMLFASVGAWKRCAASRSWYWVFAKDRQALSESASQIFDWPFTTLVPCHGEIVTEQAAAVLREGLAGRVLVASA